MTDRGTADMDVIENLTHCGRPWVDRSKRHRPRTRRHQGVGTALMTALVERARRRRCYKVQLLSLKHRPEAHRFYESIGFAPLAEGFRLYLA